MLHWPGNLASSEMSRAGRRGGGQDGGEGRRGRRGRRKEAPKCKYIGLKLVDRPVFCKDSGLKLVDRPVFRKQRGLKLVDRPALCKHRGLKLVDRPVFWPQASQRRSCLLQIVHRDFNPVPFFLRLKPYRKKGNDLLG